MEIILETINAYGGEIVRAIALLLGGALGTVAATLARKYINTEMKWRLVKIGVKFVEQVWVGIHGRDKLNKALETIEQLLKKNRIKFDAEEIEILIEAAVGEFNEVFAKKWPILEGIDVEELTDGQLRSLLQQCGFAYTENMTREEMLAALDETPDAAAK